MNEADKLKKYSQLLKENVITQEEYESKKKEILNAEGDSEKNVKAKESKLKNMSKETKKKILIVCLAVVLLFATFKVVSIIIDHHQESVRIETLEEEIQPILNKYGLTVFEVKEVSNNFEIFVEGFESLTMRDGYKCIEQLRGVSVDDPFDKNKDLDFGFVRVHPGLDVEYSYHIITPDGAAAREMLSGDKIDAGLYCNKYGNQCIYVY